MGEKKIIDTKKAIKKNVVIQLNILKFRHWMAAKDLIWR